MNAPRERLTDSVEGWIVVLVPMFTILFGATMLYVASHFGFTAMSAPVVAAAPSQH
jgi:hypothetical protein